MPGNVTERQVGGREPATDAVPSRWPLSRYDLVLALIPLAFGVAILAGTLLGVSLPTAMAAASTLGMGLILDTVYRNPPVPTR